MLRRWHAVWRRSSLLSATDAGMTFLVKSSQVWSAKSKNANLFQTLLVTTGQSWLFIWLTVMID